MRADISGKSRAGVIVEYLSRGHVADDGRGANASGPTEGPSSAKFAEKCRFIVGEGLLDAIGSRPPS